MFVVNEKPQDRSQGVNCAHLTRRMQDGSVKFDGYSYAGWGSLFGGHLKVKVELEIDLIGIWFDILYLSEGCQSCDVRSLLWISVELNTRNC